MTLPWKKEDDHKGSAASTISTPNPVEILCSHEITHIGDTKQWNWMVIWAQSRSFLRHIILWVGNIP